MEVAITGGPVGATFSVPAVEAELGAGRGASADVIPGTPARGSARATALRVCLARYIATSACSSSGARVEPSSGQDATPKLTVHRISTPFSTTKVWASIAAR